MQYNRFPDLIFHVQKPGGFDTDRSNGDNGIGCEYVSESFDKPLIIFVMTSVLAAELYALFGCMDHVLRSMAHHHVIVFTSNFIPTTTECV